METNCGEKEKISPGFVGESAGAQENEEILRKRISGHPLFGLLIENHLNCLKVGLGEFGEVGITTEPDKAADSKPNINGIIQNPSDLDHFMEAYCMALSNLKEGIEEAQQESASFIKATYLQLGELTHTNHP
ncbi:hypothetical protein VitviT2T_000496 [Vitis vinifera]|uniref:KNOX2 domain-containing protein n=2 Tax=Vitis vinifera TaxID=29760 RepID=A0ABY9BD00_VITVI|nr:protein KNATM [Vitis vinifera]RVW89198.1 hypothetical protein CK203_032643 [Vitis vinifera]WJZ80589.1 hypothetical protein VitviT2T_000496 [Vitis vinifera]|eukprot:XP_010650182.1 PREDICTED: protein KNATM [Vitis vinifera]